VMVNVEEFLSDPLVSLALDSVVDPDNPIELVDDLTVAMNLQGPSSPPQPSHARHDQFLGSRRRPHRSTTH